jgi:hypothetical protein
MWTSHKFIQSKWKNNILKKNNKQTTHFMTYYIIYENIFITLRLNYKTKKRYIYCWKRRVDE